MPPIVLSSCYWPSTTIMQEFAYSQEKHTSIAIHTKCYRISPLPRKEPQPATWLPSQTIRYAITFYSELYQQTTEIHHLAWVRTGHSSSSAFAVRFEYVTKPAPHAGTACVADPDNIPTCYSIRTKDCLIEYSDRLASSVTLVCNTIVSNSMRVGKMAKRNNPTELHSAYHWPYRHTYCHSIITVMGLNKNRRLHSHSPNLTGDMGHHLSMVRLVDVRAQHFLDLQYC
jgi:hypothetical protein